MPALGKHVGVSNRGSISSSTLRQYRAAMIASGISARTITERLRTLARAEAAMGTPALAADHHPDRRLAGRARRLAVDAVHLSLAAERVLPLGGHRRAARG